jgi:hypothetical protein
MNERTPSPVERFPTEGEVMRVMELLFKGADFTEIEDRRVEEDGKLFRLIFEGIDVEGDRMLYDYRLEKTTEEVTVDVQGTDNLLVGRKDYFTAVIDVVFHDKEGTPCGGYNVADYEQGAWKLPH